MIQVKDGDAAKLGVLFERHHVALFNFYLRMTSSRDASEDLVQDVFFRMLKYRHTYGKGSRFVTWMYTIARNAQSDYFRKRRREVDVDGHVEQRASSDPMPGQQLQQHQQERQLRNALARLPDEKRELLILSRYQGLKYEEIAELLGCDEGAVKVRVYRALRDLREIFFELSGEKAS